MKAILSITIAVFVIAPAAFAGDAKTCDKAKACEQAKGTECTSAKKSCPKEAALRVALLTHKGANIVKR